MIQAQFNKQALGYFPEIQELIKKAGEFESNQMKCIALRMINSLVVSVSEQDKGELIATNKLIIEKFRKADLIKTI